MNPIKEFFKRKATNQKFKAAGPAHRLNEESSSKDKKGSSKDKKSPSSKEHSSRSHYPAKSKAEEQAAAAALERIERQQQSNLNWTSQAIKNQAKKELELENASKQKETLKTKQVLEVKADVPNCTVSGVYFTCPMIGPEVLPRDAIQENIKLFLYEQLDNERGLTACLIIHTLNKSKVAVEKGVETLARYLSNIIDNPSEEKYRRIRLKNKVFQDRVAILEGALDFLLAAGFTQNMLPSDDGEEEYLIFQDEDLDIEKLQMLKEALLSAEPIKPVLDRNIKVLKPAQVAEEVNLPRDFYTLTLDDIRREQESRIETVELLSTLRTKEMRERDEIRERHIYKYSLIRIRFPDGLIVQGTFSVHERLSAVREFIAENLTDPATEFDLLLPGGVKTTDDDQTLLQMKLVPAVILNFQPSNESSTKHVFLSSECLALLSDL